MYGPETQKLLLRVSRAPAYLARERRLQHGSFLQVSRLCATSGSRCTSPSTLQRTYRRVRFATRVRAANNAKIEPTVDVERLGVIPFDDDRETLMDALAFTGPAPEVGCVTRRLQTLSRYPYGFSFCFASHSLVIRCICIKFMSK